MALIGYRVWQDHFARDPSVIGRSITARATLRKGNAETYTIVGVLPPSFWHLDGRSGLILPLRATRPPALMRLAAGVTPREAAIRLTGVARAQIPGIDPAWAVIVRPARDAHVGSIRRMLTTALTAMTLLAIAAIASLAFLQMARGIARQREFAVRTVLGATRHSRRRQLLREGMFVGVLAAVVALLSSTSLLSLWRPAWRAASWNLAGLLRSE